MDEDGLMNIEKIFNVVFDSILDGILIVDNDFTITHSNKSMNVWYEEKEPIVGKKCWEILGCDKVSSCPQCLIHLTFKNQSVEKSERLFNNRWYDIRFFPIMIEGKTTSVVISMRDIHSLKIREEKLKYRINLEQMVSKVSSLFARLPTDEIDKGINFALSSLGKFFNLVIVCLFQVDSKKKMLYKTHHWHQENIRPLLKVGDTVNFRSLNPIYLKLINKKAPLTLDKDSSTLSCISNDSMETDSIMIPITNFGGDSVIGFVISDIDENGIRNDVINTFQIIGDIIATAITRKTLEEQLLATREKKELEIKQDLKDWKEKFQTNHNQTQKGIDILSSMLNVVLEKGNFNAKY